MVAEFVRKALAAAGVEFVEREPGLLRVYPHPLLDELLAGEPYVELASDESLLHEHPVAVLCIPGSYPLDRILALVREMPRAFRFRAELPLPNEPPANPPVVRNAAFELRFSAPRERTATRLLVRIRVQSDMVTERLEWVAAGAAGEEGPDLLPRWEAVERTPIEPAGSGPAAPPDVLIHQAETAAGRWIEAMALGAAEHRENERARLERFRRSLATDLPGQLPSGPARRLSQTRAQVQALVELIRASLPGEGPWKTRTVTGRGWWPFHRPGLLSTLPPEEQVRFRRLLPYLGQEFGVSELEAAAREEAALRLKRLEGQVRSDPESAAQLAAAEEQLGREHQERIADLERKLQLHALITPRVVEELYYAAAEFGMRVEGGPNLTACWDPLAAAWEPMACPTCGLIARALWLCGNRTVGCDRCASRCSGCERVEARTAPLRACSRCRAPACEACGAACEQCGEWNCGKHVFHCGSCGRSRCAACGAACEVCTGAACAEHPEICGVCRKTLCAEHQARCVVCEVVVCPEDRVPCPICLGECCSPHGVECRFCRQTYCARCVSGGTCDTCGGPEPAAEATASALRSQIAEAMPSLDTGRLSAWTLARNARFRVVTARSWPWGYRFVLDEETGALVEQSRSWRPF